MKPIPLRARPLVRTDLFDTTAVPAPLRHLRLHHDELVDLLSQLLWQVARRADLAERLEDDAARGAYVYVRQSTADHLRKNHESRRRRYARADRARTLGWSEVVVIDDVLGVSAGGVARPGFERLLAAICSGRVGAVVSIEASRLARNGRDWHTLLEFCALALRRPAVCARYRCGSTRSVSSCPRRSTRTVVAAWPGDCRSTTRCSRSSPIPFTPGPTRAAAPRRAYASKPAASASCGRPKTGLFYPRKWRATTIEQFIQVLDSYIRWYKEKRIKFSLGSLSPLVRRDELVESTRGPGEYRESPGMAA